MTETLTLGQLEKEAIEEAVARYKHAVILADRCRSLTAFLETIDREHPEATRPEIAEEAKIERRAAIVEEALADAADADAELAEVGDRAPAQLVAFSRNTVIELTAARDALLPWRETAAA
ncbi:hypothetical protein [Halochromatium roseum]|uniref:hypothetical protein n=1 Tax=Halochromatium roseum TaxID=391920 RepID=UPI001913F3EB|nr:hypothetical protein [Halochromatium roseum]